MKTRIAPFALMISALIALLLCSSCGGVFAELTAARQNRAKAISLTPTRPSGKCKFVSWFLADNEKDLIFDAAGTEVNILHLLSNSGNRWNARGYMCSN